MAICINCGATSEGAKFCPECGAALVAASAERRERRVVTILFADMAGFTSRSEVLDVEDVDAFLEPYIAILSRHVARTGGVVSTIAGDGVMAVFGAPVAHEDDPERGVRAALGIRDTIVADADPNLHVRIGVTTGEVLVRLLADGSVQATGDVVNTAARLQAAAPIDGVLVDETTQRATARAIVMSEAEAVAAKGKSQPVPAWHAHEARSVVPEQRRIGGLALIGRDTEADLLRGALDRSRREPSTQLVSVIGEPGIGKSRLVEELGAYIAEVPDLITYRIGRSLSYGESVPFWALGEMVKSQAGILESDDVAVTGQKLRVAIESVILDERDREWTDRHLRPLVGLEVDVVALERDRSEAFAAWRRFFEAIAETGPTVLIFEDVHWADDALLDFIDLLATRGGAIPLLIVCTARPELFERREHWAGGKANATTISLTPLSADDTARLVGELLDQVLLPAAVQQTLLERAEGNPLYAQEYVRMLQDRGLLTHGPGGWALAGEVADLPESIHGIIAARLDTLSAGEKALIQDAAVIGRTAWVGAVREIGSAHDRSEWELDELLHALERKQLVQRARRSTIQGETEFSFGHALTRDVAYSQIRRADRAQKHEAAAAWIERLAGERDDRSELLADHYVKALALREQLGEDATPLAPRASAAFAEAARQADASYSHRAAARWYRSALELAPEADLGTRATLLLGEAAALHQLGEADEAIMTRAVEAQVAVGAWEDAANAERLLATWLEDDANRGDDTDAHLDLAAEYISRVPPCNMTFRIAATQAYRLAISGHYPELLELTNRTIPLAEQHGIDIGRALLQLWRGDARIALGDVEGVADMREAAVTLADHAYPTTPTGYGNLADVLRGLGDMRGADDAYKIGFSWANRLASPTYINFILIEQALQAYYAGDWREADRLMADALDSGYKRTLTQSTSGTSRLMLGRGDIAGARAAAESVVEAAVSLGSDDYLYPGLSVLARSRAAEGAMAESLEACTRFLDRWIETGGLHSRCMELCEIAPLLTAAGRQDEIRRAAMLIPEASRWREGLLLVAESRYAEAAALYERLGSLPFAADAHLLAAAAAREDGNEALVRAHAQAVADFAALTGAVLYQAEADRLLQLPA